MTSDTLLDFSNIRECNMYCMLKGIASVASGEIQSQDNESIIFLSYNASDLTDIIRLIPGIYAFYRLVKDRKEIRKDIISISKKVCKIYPPRKYWPEFFYEMKKERRLSEITRDRIKHFGKLGKYPPSSEIYNRATEKLYSIQVTYSEALDAERREKKGLIQLVEACQINKNLEVNLCIADPVDLLRTISDFETEALYNEKEDELIKDIIETNCYNPDRLKKFLFDSNLDYLRKINDSYAALSILNIYNKSIDNRITFWTYHGNPTLRATFAYGNERILDFVYFPERAIGMAGTLNRCYVNDDYPEENYIFKEAERERDRLELKEKEGSDLLETMRQKLIEGFDEMNIYPKPSNKDLVTNEIKEIININDLLNKRITEKCELKFREKRNQFLTRIAHCAEPKIGIVPSP